MNIFGTARGDELFATAAPNEVFFGRGGGDRLTLLATDTTDSFNGGKGLDALTWDFTFDWTNQDYSTFATGVTFDGGKGFDGVSLTGVISDGNTTINYSFLGVQVTSVEGIMHVLQFDDAPDLDANITLNGTNSNDWAFVGPLAQGQSADLVANFGAGADQLYLINEDIQNPGAAFQSINVSMGRGADTVSLLTSADGAVFNLGQGKDLAFSDGNITGVGKFAETFLGGRGRDTIILNPSETAQDADTVKGGGGRDMFVVNNLRTEFSAGTIQDFKSGKDEVVIINDQLLGQSVQFDFQATDALVYLAGSGRLVFGTADDNHTVLDFDGTPDLIADDFSIRSNFELIDLL